MTTAQISTPNAALANPSAPSIALLNDLLERHFNALLADKAALARRVLEFTRDGYTKFKINELVPEPVTKAVRQEVFDLVESHAVRRDMHIETTGNSPRYMSTVPRRFIEENGTVVRTIYESDAVKKYLGAIAGDSLKPSIKDENYIIAKLEKRGDTHGWHWGDYPYTLIWIIEAPKMEHGGLLQCIPHTEWNKSDPRINWFIANNLIKSYFHETGEVYFLKSDTTLHRVTPMETEGIIRIILNTCWASESDTRGEFEHETLNAAFL